MLCVCVLCRVKERDGRERDKVVRRGRGLYFKGKDGRQHVHARGLSVFHPTAHLFPTHPCLFLFRPFFPPTLPRKGRNKGEPEECMPCNTHTQRRILLRRDCSGSFCVWLSKEKQFCVACCAVHHRQQCILYIEW